MKRLLLSITALFVTYVCFSQVPANDLIENAIEITVPNFSDSVNISEASLSLGGQTGCTTAGFKTVYYKFTALVTGSVKATLGSGTPNLSFVIFYTATDLNVTSEAELALAPGAQCFLGLQANIDIVAGQSYYLLASQDDVTTSTILVATLPQTVPQNERDALIAIYNATNGNNWLNNTNWNTAEPESSWYGITVENNRVEGIDLTGNNLTGIIPPEIGDLTELVRLSFFVNDITGEVPTEIWSLSKLKTLWIGLQASKQFTLTNGIPPEISNLQQLEWLNVAGIALTQPLQPELFNLPNFAILRIYDCGLKGTLPAELAGLRNVLAYQNEFEGAIPQDFIDATGIQSLDIRGNYFDFSDLEPLVAAANIVPNFAYSPQRTADSPETIAIPPGQDITFTVNDTEINRQAQTPSPNNQYQWFKDDAAIAGQMQIRMRLSTHK